MIIVLDVNHTGMLTIELNSIWTWLESKSTMEDKFGPQLDPMYSKINRPHPRLGRQSLSLSRSLNCEETNGFRILQRRQGQADITSMGKAVLLRCWTNGTKVRSMSATWHAKNTDRQRVQWTSAHDLLRFPFTFEKQILAFHRRPLCLISNVTCRHPQPTP